MSPRFLFGGTEVASLGGASTALYDLFQRFLKDGHDAHLVNILESQDAAFFQYTFEGSLGNPSGVANVSVCWLTDDPMAPQPALREIVERLNPDVLVGFGYYASMLFKQAAPERRTVFVTGSCQQAQDYIMSGRAEDAIALGQWLAGRAAAPRLLHPGERIAMDRVDLVVTHSPQTRSMIQWFFPSSMGKIYPDVISFAEWICDGALPWRDQARPFDDRDIDVLFIATDWDRPVKNYPLVEAIANQLGSRSVHIVGDVPHPTPHATHHGFLESRDTVFDLLGRARAVVSPSLIDAAPGILWEGSVLGCNVVASKNCGNWELCHPDLLVDPFGLESFVTCIRRALTRKFDDNRNVCLAQRGYTEFVALLTAFAQPFQPSSPS